MGAAEFSEVTRGGRSESSVYLGNTKPDIDEQKGYPGHSTDFFTQSVHRPTYTHKRGRYIRYTNVCSHGWTNLPRDKSTVK